MLNLPSRPGAAPLAAALAVLFAAAATGSAHGGETPPLPVMEPGEILWQGMPDALLRLPGARPFELAPDARGFLYLQGPPWPRVMLQPLPPGPGDPLPEPVVLGMHAPHGGRPPRFDHTGRHVFYTAELGPSGAALAWSPSAGNPPGPAPLPPPAPAGLAVVRATVRGLAEERLLPPVGSERDESAVFLDADPGGRTILVGVARGIEPARLRTGDYSLALRELSFDDEGRPLLPARPLEFQVNARAQARYSWDGRAIYYSAAPAGGDSAAIIRYQRSSALHEPLTLDGPGLGRLAGDVEAVSWPVLHPGSFGHDGFALEALSRSPAGPWVLLPVAERLLAPFPLRPVSVRGDRTLLVGGLEDRLRVAVARWDPALLEAALQASRASTHPLLAGRAALAPGFSLAEVRAHAEDREAEALLREVLRTLGGTTGPSRAARTRWARNMLGPAPRSAGHVEATELLSGEILIERILPPAKEGEAPPRETAVWNGREGWTSGEGGETVSLPREALAAQAALASPFRLLFDPAGLGLPYLSFRSAGAGTLPGPGGVERRLRRLSLRAIGGYAAEVLVEESAGRALPVRIESPLLFPEDRLRRSMGAVPEQKAVVFDAYREAAGRLVPGRVRFEDGLNPFELVLEELVLDPPQVEGLFRK